MKAPEAFDHARKPTAYARGIAAARKALLPLLFIAVTCPSIYAASAAAAASTGLAGIVADNAALEKVLDGFKLADGAAFSRANYFILSDAPNGTIWKCTSVDGKVVQTVLRTSSGGARGLSFDRQGRLLACETGARRVTRTEKNGAITVLAERFNGKRLNGPDDVAHAIDGSTYFTDPGERPASKGEKREQRHAGVYQVTRAGQLRMVVEDFESPDGLTLSADQRLLYVSDAGKNHIRVFSIKADGALANGKVFATMKSSATGAAGGLETDLDGNVYATGPGGVWVFDQSGRHRGTLAVPEAPTNVAWGDDYNTLYVTAGTSLYRIKLKVSGTRTY